VTTGSEVSGIRGGTAPVSFRFPSESRAQLLGSVKPDVDMVWGEGASENVSVIKYVQCKHILIREIMCNDARIIAKELGTR
jgi:hypothetical protein